jgi:hypothetical protein
MPEKMLPERIMCAFSRKIGAVRRCNKLYSTLENHQGNLTMQYEPIIPAPTTTMLCFSPPIINVPLCVAVDEFIWVPVVAYEGRERCWILASG